MSEVKEQDTVETVTMRHINADEPVAETKVMPQAEPEDAARTEVMPQTSSMDAAQTQVVPQAVSREDATRPVARRPEPVEQSEPSEPSDLHEPSGSSVPRGGIPLDELARRRQQAADEAHRQSHPLGDNTVPMYTGAPFRSAETTAPVEPASVIHTPAPTGVSAGTVVLGVLLVLLGAVAIVMAGMVPNWPFGAVDPWVAAAVSIGAVGVTLVVIAIIWAVTNAVSSRRRERK
ncbi:hypothetical protein [Bifidobacterium thermacidophilum]|uniref:hypothetical protein n=1 Tax=Bifidobacterium thermacidophilum TaxID=246618 RepID=UPI0026F1C5D1|nr:hypothetical protein [Bifidobacterium thermacidophilum]